MNRKSTQQTKETLTRQQNSGAHKPATECPKCGTIRTPGQTHKANDTGPEPLGLGAQGCNG